MEIILIAAAGLCNEIGKDNKLLWKLPNDMNFFAERTKGHVVIMGRKTYQSIPKKFRPLKDRVNIVISNEYNFSDEGVTMAYDFDDAISKAKSLNSADIYIAGGRSLYFEGLEIADRILLTRVLSYYSDADTHFPALEFGDWKLENIPLHQDVDEKHLHEFIIFDLVREKL